MTTNIHFIGGEKGGVGKSVVARVIAQYAIDRGIPFVALDADSSHGALMRYYADHTRPVDLSAFESADAIMVPTAIASPIVSFPACASR